MDFLTDLMINNQSILLSHDANQMHHINTNPNSNPFQKSAGPMSNLESDANAALTTTNDIMENEQAYTRWWWWLVIAYMFYAQATICDEYFVESIKVMVERFQIPEDVAGATLMALGCNGPELFTNLIAIFITHSDLGVGTIVGSEIFNLLCIIGGSIIATSKLPLCVTRSAFTRDCTFYAASTALLYWVLLDQQVEFHEAAILLFGCVCYALTVSFTAPFLKWWEGEISEDINEGNGRGSIVVKRRGTMQSFGSIAKDFVSVEISRHQRFAPDEKAECIVNTTSQGIEILPKIGDEDGSFSQALGTLQEPLLNASGDNIIKRVVLYSDMFLLETTTRSPELTLQVEDEASGKISVNFVFKSMESREVLEEVLCRKIKEVRQSDMIQPVALVNVWEEFKHTKSLWRKCLLLCAIPMEALLGFSMSWCDVKLPGKSDKYASCFCMSMFWLAVFSYLMCVVADIIHVEFGIPTSILGITLCAVGTSFPNLYASILMAWEGRSAMAVANALGSNVQNVLLALAFPWFLRTAPFLGGSTYPIATNGISTGIEWMAFTLGLVVVFALIGNCKFDKWMGYVMMSCYLVYLCMAIF